MFSLRGLVALLIDPLGRPDGLFDLPFSGMACKICTYQESGGGLFPLRKLI